MSTLPFRNPPHTHTSNYSPSRGPDDRAAQGAVRRTPLPSLADDGHPAAHAAPAVRGLVDVPLQAVAAAERVRLGGIPHAHLARARRPDRGAADRAGSDHARERRDVVVAPLVRYSRGEGAGGAGAEARRGEARAGTHRFGAAEDRADWSSDAVRWEDTDRRGRTRGEHLHFSPHFSFFFSFCCVNKKFILSLQSVVLYWVSSATFGLLQSWVFDYWDRRRSNVRGLLQSVPPPGPTTTNDRPAQTFAPVPKPKRR